MGLLRNVRVMDSMHVGGNENPTHGRFERLRNSKIAVLELCREQPDPKLYARMEQDLETMNALLGEFLEFSRGVGGEPPVPTDVAVLLAHLADAYSFGHLQNAVRQRGFSVVHMGDD